MKARRLTFGVVEKWIMSLIGSSCGEGLILSCPILLNVMDVLVGHESATDWKDDRVDRTPSREDTVVETYPIV